jgi:hypothetical protein
LLCIKFPVGIVSNFWETSGKLILYVCISRWYETMIWQMAASTDDMEFHSTLQTENDKLKKQIKRLTIEKNKLEDQLYRAFWKCLNTKKRKIAELEKELSKVKGDNKNNNGRNKKARLSGNKTRRRAAVPISDSEDDVASERSEEDAAWRDKYEDSSETELDDDIVNDQVEVMGKDKESDVPADKNSSSSVIPPKKTNEVDEEKMDLATTESESSQSQEGPLAFPFPKDFVVSRQRKQELKSQDKAKTTKNSSDDEPEVEILEIDDKPNRKSNKESQKPVHDEDVVVEANSQDSTSTGHDLDELLDDL